MRSVSFRISAWSFSFLFISSCKETACLTTPSNLIFSNSSCPLPHSLLSGLPPSTTGSSWTLGEGPERNQLQQHLYNIITLTFFPSSNGAWGQHSFWLLLKDLFLHSQHTTHYIISDDVILCIPTFLLSSVIALCTSQITSFRCYMWRKASKWKLMQKVSF